MTKVSLIDGHIETCKFCEEGAFNTLIESSYEQYGYNVFGNVGLYEKPETEDNSVVFEIRNGAGYIRLGDRQEMGCLDHCDKIKIPFCPMCGRELKE